MNWIEFKRMDSLLEAAGPRVSPSGRLFAVTSYLGDEEPTDPVEVAEIAHCLIEEIGMWRNEHDPNCEDLAALQLKAGLVELREMAAQRAMPIADAIEGLQQGISAMARWGHARGLRIY